ncbi:glycosyltransferase [Yinghuangia sp. YIM S10712]|uniref:glycosyltransferase n=1 Tax=Yinghuangia sp. YIM S10712 TaxID=3436930 RepID=UPI003F529877
MNALGWRALVRCGTVLAAAGAAHAWVNAARLRVPPSTPPQVREPVSVLVPARDEAGNIGACVRSLLAQQGVDDLEVLVLDDGSTDDTAVAATAAAFAAPTRAAFKVIRGGDGPGPVTAGKTRACERLAAAARGCVLVFVDADVILAPHAVAASVALLRQARLDLVSPYPRQLADGLAPRLVQPLLQWSWLTTLPLQAAERSRRPSLTAANGQFLVVDRHAYDACGGFGALRTASERVLDDIALLRAVKRAWGRGVVVDGTHLAVCRMYEGWADLRDGYSKSLWAAFGAPGKAAAVGAALALVYLVPPAAALAGSRTGALGYAFAVAGRVICARRTGGRAWPDSLAHPLSVIVWGVLTARSFRHHRRGTLHWKGRPVHTPQAYPPWHG